MPLAAIFPDVAIAQGFYESFYLRAVSPREPIGAWIRYTVQKRPGARPVGSVWCTVFDASGDRAGPLANGPFMHRADCEDLQVPTGGWIAVGNSQLGPGRAEGSCGEASWSLRFVSDEPELHHLPAQWMYRTSLPKTKLSTPFPAARFTGTVRLASHTIELEEWHGMVGHNWGAQHAERWIWMHAVDFADAPGVWLDVAVAKVRLAGVLSPWVANGALSLQGERLRVGGLGARGVRVLESTRRCTLSLPGERGLRIEAHVDVPAGCSAGWRYADPDGSEHDVVNCSVAALTLSTRMPDAPGRMLSTAHGAAYELGMREHDHGVPIAPFAD